MKKFKSLVLFLVFLMFATIVLPNKVSRAEGIDQIISEGKIVIKSIPPANINDAYAVFETVSEEYEGYYIDASTCNSSYTKATIKSINGDEEKEVEIDYEYDADVKKVVDNIMAKLPSDVKNFTLSDMEYLNYLLNSYESMANGEEINISTYCGELKKFIDYKNFVIEPRMGDDGYFFSYKAGNATFEYDGTIYGFVDLIGVYAKSVIYVDDNETDIENAIKTRVSKVFTDKNIKVYKNEMTIDEFLDGETEWNKSWYDQNEEYFLSQNISKDEYVQNIMDEYYYNSDAPCNFLLTAEENTYGIEIDDAMIEVAVVRDSSKINDNISLVTNDVSSDITVSTTSKSIPLDALISVAKLTSGDEYDKIVKLLDVTNSEMFDLKLYSKSAGDYITKLSDGTFEVKIPVSESLKGKDLIAYYVDENDEITEYGVTVKDGYAVFTTNHFSIYTLAEKETEEPDQQATETDQDKTTEQEHTTTEEEITKATDPETTTTSVNTAETTNTNETKTEIKNEEKVSNSPKTGDNIIKNTAILVSAVLGAIIIHKYKKKI